MDSQRRKQQMIVSRFNPNFMDDCKQTNKHERGCVHVICSPLISADMISRIGAARTQHVLQKLLSIIYISLHSAAVAINAETGSYILQTTTTTTTTTRFIKRHQSRDNTISERRLNARRRLPWRVHNM